MTPRGNSSPSQSAPLSKEKAGPFSPALTETHQTIFPARRLSVGSIGSNGGWWQGACALAHDERIGIGKRIAVVLANRAKFSRDTSASPQKLDAMTCSAFWTNAFRRFLAQADRLNAFDPLFRGAVFLFCFHRHFSSLALGVKWFAEGGMESIDGNQGGVSFKRRARSSGNVNSGCAPWLPLDEKQKQALCQVPAVGILSW
jgi:hypothetical protein